LRLAPIAFEVAELLAAFKLGVNASPPQPLTWKGLLRPLCVAPNVDVRFVSVASGVQLLGLNRKLLRFTVTLNVCKRSGTPLTIVGRALLTVTRPLYGFTPIAARVMTVPRSNGPAAAAIGIDRP
jgi:hypothetical protein